MVWAGKDFKIHPVPPLAMGTYHYPCFLQALSSLAVEPSRDGAFTIWDSSLVSHILLLALLGHWRDGMHILGSFGACPAQCHVPGRQGLLLPPQVPLCCPCPQSFAWRKGCLSRKGWRWVQVSLEVFVLERQADKNYFIK